MVIRTLSGMYVLRRRSHSADALMARVEDLGEALSSNTNCPGTSAQEARLEFTPIDPEIPRPCDETGTERPARVTLPGRFLRVAMRLRHG
jgi:hypothetical protein